ncbi:energy transducer TonB [Winogradskyella endarachnes]|uniref:TonB family protein n=1 Tax=Winogradskyella endarachnes TaxID=2681965 RepID=A0A6L6U889_9FLAO|nr:hypothetical protein [Winogradskyella endarachnes]MUU78560.1 hypothetical protein [Winogradskyella endarachnes]
MSFIEKHKALIITFLLSSTIVLLLFSAELKLKGKLISESYYLLEPEPEKTIEELKQLEDLNAESTNKAFNEDQEYKEMMRNFKSVSANDFERTTKAIEEAKASKIDNQINEENTIKSYANGGDYALNTSETASYKELQEELKQRLKNKKLADEHAKNKGTLTYSLKGRTLAHYEIPRYLCEIGGKIVVNIKVNASGDVYDAYVNGSSNSNNKCLVEHALDYAKSVAFDASTKKDQIGTITFMFKGK